MRENVVTKTEEVIVRTEYITEDGTIFYNQESALNYEKSALFIVNKKLKRLNTGYASMYDLIDWGSDEAEIEIFDVQNNEDLENLGRYLYLKLSSQGYSNDEIEKSFRDFASITVGHEVIIEWNYEKDTFYFYGDGSLNGYFDYIRERYNRIIATKQDSNNENN